MTNGDISQSKIEYNYNNALIGTIQLPKSTVLKRTRAD